MNIFNFDYETVLRDFFLMMAWGIFMGVFFSFIKYLILDWLEKKGLS